MAWCSYCGSDRHNVEYCEKTWNGQANLSARHCIYCDSRDHYVERCPKTWDGQISNRVNPE